MAASAASEISRIDTVTIPVRFPVIGSNSNLRKLSFRDWDKDICTWGRRSAEVYCEYIPLQG